MGPVPASELVDVAPFRELVEQRVREGASWGEIAARMNVSSDRLTRALGKRPWHVNHGPKTVQTHITREFAARVVRACDAWLMDYDL